MKSMNPLDKSWDFLKAPMEGGENKKPLAERAAERRRKLRAAAAAKKRDIPDDARRRSPQRVTLNDPMFQSAARAKQMEESGQFPGHNRELAAQIRANNRKARKFAEEEAEGPKYPNPPMSEPSQSALVSSTGINDPHDPRTMQPRRGA